MGGSIFCVDWQEVDRGCIVRVSIDCSFFSGSVFCCLCLCLFFYAFNYIMQELFLLVLLIQIKSAELLSSSSTFLLSKAEKGRTGDSGRLASLGILTFKGQN